MSGAQDLPADFSTTATLIPGVVFTSDFDPECGDTDYIRIEVEYGRSYRVIQSFPNAALSIRDDRDWGIEQYDGTYGDATHTFRARYTGSYYVSLTSQDLRPYHVLLEEVFSDVDGFESYPTIVSGEATVDRLELSGDIDSYLFYFEAGKTYQIDVFGADTGHGTLRDPFVGLRFFGDGTNVFNNDSGFGKNAWLQFVAPVTGYQSVNVRSGNSGTGSYRLLIRQADDYVMGPATTARLNLAIPAVGLIETIGDIDWMRVSLTEDQWYRVTLQSDSLDFRDPLTLPALIVRDPSRNVVDVARVSRPNETTSDGSTVEVLFRSAAAGDFFVIARGSASDMLGQYQLTAEAIDMPFFRDYQNETDRAAGVQRFTSIDGTRLPLESMFFTGVITDQIQVFSQFDLVSAGTIKPGGVIYTISPPDLGNWAFAGQLDGEADVFVRVMIGGEWSGWQRTPLIGFDSNDELLSGQQWDGIFKVGLPTGLPPEHAGAFSDFQAIPIDSALHRDIQDVSQRWSEELFHWTTDAGETDISIFLSSDIADYYQAYLPGDGVGGDIVLSSNFFDPDQTVSDNARNQHELLQALGRSLGLDFLPGSTQFDSVMAESDNDGANSVTPANLDGLAIEKLYGVDGFSGTSLPTVDSIRTLTLGVVDPTSTLARIDTYVENAGDNHFDLRERRPNYVLDDNQNQQQLVIIGRGTVLFNADGGDGRDVVFGNSAANTLSGSAGHDYLEGRGGDDHLMGGTGNDWYGYSFGGGHDLITEAGSGQVEHPGRDAIRLMGFGPLDISFETLWFSREQNDLLINLSMDGSDDGSVRVEKNAFGNFRVELLELFNNGISSTPAVSLVNLFGQLEAGQKSQFQLASGSDNFGRLVTSV